MGEERLDMIEDNIGIMKDVVDGIKKYYTHGAIMVVSNPVDILTYKCDEWMGLPNGRVFGTGCILDTSRLVRSIANYTNLNIEAIKCNIVGEHGSSQFPVNSGASDVGVLRECGPCLGQGAEGTHIQRSKGHGGRDYKR